MSAPRNLIIVLATAAAALAPASALAKDGDVTKRGTCSTSSSAKRS